MRPAIARHGETDWRVAGRQPGRRHEPRPDLIHALNNATITTYQRLQRAGDT
jgi:broad specificity phosphatase PhoE